MDKHSFARPSAKSLRLVGVELVRAGASSSSYWEARLQLFTSQGESSRDDSECPLMVQNHSTKLRQ